PRSLNKEQNRRFKKWVQSTDLPLGARLFGFFWIPRWVDAHQRAVSVKKVREQWLALKELDAPLAEKLLKSLEAPGDAIRKRIPYGSIRNRIKDHTFTKGSVEELRLISAVRPLYLALLDPSVIALNGLYSHYQKMITGSRIPQHILTTGYKLCDDEVDALRFGVALEQKIRHAVARRWFFYPVEPNSIFLVESEEETIPQSFLDKQKAESLEGRRFAKNIIAARELTVKNTRFSCRGAVTIVARERFFTQSITEVGAVTTKNRGQKRVQKALRGISQNHFNSYKWAKSFLPWLSVPYNVALIPSIQKALNAFEPFSLAESLYQGPYNQSAYEQVLRLFPTYFEWMEWSLEHFEEVWEFDETTSEAFGKALYKELKDQKKLRVDDSRTLFQNLAKIRLGMVEECAEELLEAGLEQEEILNILYSGLESATVIYNMMIDL
ncbi:MAG: hypothetical protein KDK48_02400, partial [Chlamydiia bacterium]|nr:hypothetical protein [Chlamydiia bacterium]